MSKFIECKYNKIHIDPKFVTAIIKKDIPYNATYAYWLSIIVNGQKIDLYYKEEKQRENFVNEMLSNCE